MTKISHPLQAECKGPEEEGYLVFLDNGEKEPSEAKMGEGVLRDRGERNK